jgi:ABC-type sugar transport system ATPase subunit
MAALGIDLDQPLGELPVAQKQLVAIARALLHNARLIIMDEPTSALTGVEVDTLLKIIPRLKQEGVAILFVSHKLREVLSISDRLTVLRNGEVVAEGPAAEFDEANIAYHMTGRTLQSILVAVLGGVNPAGGFGKVRGVSIAVLALQFLASGFNMLRFSNFAKEFVWGAFLLLIMVINHLSRGRSNE